MKKAEWLCLDIESRMSEDQAVIESIAQHARDTRPAASLSRETKASWDKPESVNERIATAIAKTAVDPLLAVPLCICVSCLEGEVVTIDGMERDSRAMLLEIVDLIDTWCDQDTVFVGHNVERFDLPLLLAQFQKHGIVPPKIFPTYRRGRWRGNIWDTMGACPGKSPFISLIEAALAYGFEAKAMEWRGERMTGARVSEAYEAGMLYDKDAFQVIRDYCAQDVRDETRLFLIQTCGGVWGVDSRMSTTAEQLTEIAESNLTPAQKWLAAMPALRSYGLMK